MPGSTGNYFVNLANLFIQKRLLRPLAVTYYLTTRCNLNCSYCEDFGARRNAQAMPPLPPASTEKVKAKLATANPHLLTLIGYGGILLILWLMMFKPF